MMVLVPVLSVALAIIIDLALGDPRNKYHPTAWIGIAMGRLVPHFRSGTPVAERLGGTTVVILVSFAVGILLYLADRTFSIIAQPSGGIAGALALASSAAAMGLLLKTTIAIRGMHVHASKIMEPLGRDDLETARANLSMIVKRNTQGLGRQHIMSATLESMSENIVDGITGPLFYFSFFGLAGAFVYRTINTADSMIGYKTDLFRNLGWFGANCDKILNLVPSRLTSLVMVLAGMILGCDWRRCAEILRRDGSKTESPNAGYPMAAMAGALGVRFEKIDHYVLGEGNTELTMAHFEKGVSLMKITAILFAVLFSIPVIVLLSYLGWWGIV